MPAEISGHTDRAIAPWIAGLLPDNDAVIRRWAREFRTAASPFSLLGTPVGEDCAGAVQFAFAGRVEALSERPGTTDWLSESEVAMRLRTLARDGTSWLGSDSTGRFSLAGAQAKIALFHDGRRWGLPSGVTPTSHILKPAVSGLDDHDLNEHLSLAAARRAGLIAARTSVVRFEDQSAILIERYDRIPSDAGLRRIHQEDLCQALGFAPSAKYQADGGPGAEAIIGLLRTVLDPHVVETSVWRFVDALIWNWLLAGTDAHAKNYSLLLSGAQVRSAPLYDVASALPYPDTHERSLRLAMKLGRDYHVFPHHDPWPGAARAWGLEPMRLRERVLDLAERAVDALADAAADHSVRALGSSMPGRLIDLVAGRIRRCRRVMDADPSSSGKQ